MTDNIPFSQGHYQSFHKDEHEWALKGCPVCIQKLSDTDMSAEERAATTLMQELSAMEYMNYSYIEKHARVMDWLTTHAEQARRKGLEDAALHVYHQWNDYKGPDDMAEGIRALKEGNDEK